MHSCPRCVYVAGTLNDAPKDDRNEVADGLSLGTGLSEAQGRKVMMALVHGQEARKEGLGFSDADLAKVISAVHTLFVGGVVAKMIFAGEMLIQVDDEGEVRYLTAPGFFKGEDQPSG